MKTFMQHFKEVKKQDNCKHIFNKGKFTYLTINGIKYKYDICDKCNFHQLDNKLKTN